MQEVKNRQGPEQENPKQEENSIVSEILAQEPRPKCTKELDKMDKTAKIPRKENPKSIPFPIRK
ncbi:hypothetical protein N7519_003636 [Penicillium mononematosum]|uniref:uncharacterized protein n=1 Tax=Penicillium mononematosum TaxID=268346 RepID=UPI002547030C|nr:uncharacterized protein N7519_003636 [Penicillium mononematosum]KAJ6188728.1 hypothetical protein N7519_003636 [Penicillium mononematosum]